MWGAIPVVDRSFKTAVRDVTEIRSHPLEQAMASCHSLTLIDGNLTGDPLDVKVSSNSIHRGLLEKYPTFFFLNLENFNEAYLQEATLNLHMHA